MRTFSGYTAIRAAEDNSNNNAREHKKRGQGLLRVMTNAGLIQGLSRFP